MFLFCKFSKRNSVISDKKTWFVKKWNIVLLDRLDIADWNLSKIIISNRNRKFFFDMWTTIFEKLKIKFMYSTTYHFQIDEQNERINQIIEIVFRFYLIIMKNFADWSNVLSVIQRHFNNHRSVVIDKTSNEIVYDFTSMQSFSLRKSVDAKQSIMKWKSFTKTSFSFFARVKIEIADFIAFVQMQIKHHYDRKHQSLYMKFENYVYIRLHHEYDIFAIAMFESKLSQQYAEFFKILKKIDQLFYRLDLFTHWRIHFVLSMTQLKSTFFDENFYRKSKSIHSNFVFVEKNTELIKFFEIERLINKRQIARRDFEYFVRWLEYFSQFDEWRNFSKLKNAMNLIHDYEFVMKFAIFLSDRLNDTDKSIKNKSTKRLDMKKSFEINKIVIKKSFAIDQFSIFTFNQRFVVVIRKSFTTKSNSFVDLNFISSKSTSSTSSTVDSMIFRSARTLRK